MTFLVPRPSSVCCDGVSAIPGSGTLYFPASPLGFLPLKLYTAWHACGDFVCTCVNSYICEIAKALNFQCDGKWHTSCKLARQNLGLQATIQILGRNSMKDTMLKLYIKAQNLKSAVMEEHGQDLVEYALVIALIALAATAGMKTLASDLSNAFSTV